MTKDAASEVCRDCGCVVGDRRRHRRFHQDLNGPTRIKWVGAGPVQPDPPDSYAEPDPAPPEPKD